LFFLYCFLSLCAFCHAILILTYVVATKIGSYVELDTWNIIHILGFIMPKFVSVFVVLIAALAIFRAWIWEGVVIGKFLNGVDVRNIVNTKLPGLGTC